MSSPSHSVASLKDEVLQRFPALREASDATLEQLLAQSTLREAPAGAVMFEPDSPCRGFPLLLDGVVRVMKSAPNGREVLLYTIRAGEGCLLSSSCLLGGQHYAARGIAATPLRLLSLSPAAFNALVAESKPFRDYVFGLFSERLADLMELVEAVTFQRLDQRLAALLLRKDNPVRATHQGLADELGSVREMVSRLLRNFEDRGWVALARERIDIVDRQALELLAGG